MNLFTFRKLGTNLRTAMMRLFIFFVLIMLWSCQGAGEKQTSQAEKLPHLEKIPITSKAQADSLIQAGVDVIVVEDHYVIARINPADLSILAKQDLKMEPFKEDELVQRLVNIPVTDKSQVTELAGLGMDIWQVRADTVVAQVFDSQIRAARAKGFQVTVVEQNVMNTVKKKDEK